jgi:hypothetical protein
MKLSDPRKKRLTLKQLIASLVIDPETGAVIWAASRQKKRGPFPNRKDAYSDESGHLFRFVSDTDPTISDSCRSEATLGLEQ